MGIVYTLISCFFSATIWVFVRQLSPEISIDSQILLRLLVSSTILYIIFYKYIRIKEILNISGQDFAIILLRGISLYLIGTALAASAIQESTYGSVVLILSLPFGSLIAVYLLNEKLQTKEIFSLLLSLVGVILVISDRHGVLAQFNIGIMKAILACFLMALSLVSRRFQSKNLREIELTFILLLLSGILFLGKMLILGRAIDLPQSYSSLGMVIASGIWTAGFLYFVGKALMLIEVIKVNVIYGLQPIIAAVVGVFIYKEAISINLLMGILCVIASILLVNLKFNFRRKYVQ